MPGDSQKKRNKFHFVKPELSSHFPPKGGHFFLNGRWPKGLLDIFNAFFLWRANILDVVVPSRCMCIFVSILITSNASDIQPG